MNLQQRKEAQAKLKQTYGATLTALIAQRTGLSANYVRDWFRIGKPQPIIEAKVIDLLRELQEKQEEVTGILQTT